MFQTQNTTDELRQIIKHGTTIAGIEDVSRLIGNMYTLLVSMDKHWIETLTTIASRLEAEGSTDLAGRLRHEIATMPATDLTPTMMAPLRVDFLLDYPNRLNENWKNAVRRALDN